MNNTMGEHQALSVEMLTKKQVSFIQIHSGYNRKILLPCYLPQFVKSLRFVSSA